MTAADGLVVEGIRVPWSSIVAAYPESGGLTVCWRTPPYVGWTEAGADGEDDVGRALRRRGLLRGREEARAAWNEVLRRQLQAAIERGFRDPARAREMLAVCSIDGRPPSPRLSLALVDLSGGSLEELERCCQLAAIDYRDVYFNAWYAG